ncbi:MAG: hypothetical protein ABI454_08890 [Sphingomicrobium sp.]
MFKAETGNGSEHVVKHARENMQAVRDRIDALGRAREVSKAAELEEEQRQIAATNKERAATTLANAKAYKAAAARAQKQLESLIEACGEVDKAHARFASGIAIQIAEKPNDRTVRDLVSNRFDGPVILGQLRAAGVQALDTVESALDAMHAWKGQTLDGIIGSQVDKALRLASAGVSELRSAMATHNEDSDPEAEAA